MSLESTFYLSHPSGEDIYLFVLRNAKNTEVCITNYGAIISSFRVNGVNIVLGFDVMDSYLSEEYLSVYPYFGCIVGRYANRIKKGTFQIGEKTYYLSTNSGADHIHGGNEGFDKKVWKTVSTFADPNPGLVLEYISHDGEEGYPGNLTVRIRFELTEENELIIETTAECDQDSIINLTHHDYFNLNGYGQICDHLIQIPASQILGQDENLVADGRLLEIENSLYDFRKPRTIRGSNGNPLAYDQTFILEKPESELRLAASCIGNLSGLKLEVITTEPAVHFYTAAGLPEISAGKEKIGGSFGGLCFETQKHPNAINIPHFPETILRADKLYREKTMYKVTQSAEK